MWCYVRFSVWPCSHDFPHFILSHLIHFECFKVNEESPTDLVCNYCCEQYPPSNTEDHIKGDAHGTDPSQLLMSAQEIYSSTSCSETIGSESEW